MGILSHAKFRRHERIGRPLGQAHFIEKLEVLLNRPLKLQKAGRKKKKQVWYSPIYRYMSNQPQMRADTRRFKK